MELQMFVITNTLFRSSDFQFTFDYSSRYDKKKIDTSHTNIVSNSDSIFLISRKEIWFSWQRTLSKINNQMLNKYVSDINLVINWLIHVFPQNLAPITKRVELGCWCFDIWFVLICILYIWRKKISSNLWNSKGPPPQC